MSVKEVVRFVLLFIWQLPQNIVAVVMLPFLGKMSIIKIDNACVSLVGTRMSGGITLGSFIFLSKASAQEPYVIEHEYGHVKDSHLFGPLYLLIIGLPSLLWAASYSCSKKSYEGRTYYDFFTERRANRNAGLAVVRTGKCSYHLTPESDRQEEKDS
ncbi:hypothetical protein EOM86_12605 [Candidatus Nomurabacteria bacterium]|nr:hypothetical protein [Candidatus Nomurabacteria bacterium]